MQEHQIVVSVHNMERRRYIERARNAGNEAVRGRVIITAMRQFTLYALGTRPRLIRQLAIGRVFDDAASVPDKPWTYRSHNFAIEHARLRSMHCAGVIRLR